MLYIKGKSGLSASTWHIGENLDSVVLAANLNHVVTFQADGEELEFIVQAMKNEWERAKMRGVVFTK